MTTINVENLRFDIIRASMFAKNLKGAEKKMDLTYLETRVLLSLTKSEVRTRDQIGNDLYGEGHAFDQRTIDRHICAIRKELVGTDIIINAISNVGYQIIFPKSVQ